MNDVPGAKDAFQSARECWERLVAQSPMPEHLQSLAWFLVSCPDPEVRNPEQAVELAKRAIGQTPPNPTYHNTLGAAYCRAEDWPAAVESIREAIRLREEGNGRDWFFLGMAQWHLDAQEEANQSYQQGCQWMQENQPDNPELKRLRAEAAKLLGVPEAGGTSQP